MFEEVRKVLDDFEVVVKKCHNGEKLVREEYSGWVGVFFGEALAYTINNPNQRFYEDVKEGNMQPTYKASVYRRER